MPTAPAWTRTPRRPEGARRRSSCGETPPRLHRGRGIWDNEAINRGRSLTNANGSRAGGGRHPEGLGPLGAGRPRSGWGGCTLDRRRRGGGRAGGLVAAPAQPGGALEAVNGPARGDAVAAAPRRWREGRGGRLSELWDTGQG